MFYTQQLQKNGAVLAPMAGYSDAPMRQLATEHGALWTVSEMLSSRGLVLGGEDETLSLGRPFAGETNRVVQLFGSDPDILAAAVAKVETWFSPAAIDLNMGCPVPKIRGKGGACLLQTPDVAYTLIRAMKSATTLDVSAKIRLGWDSNHSLELAAGLSEAGVSLITVHGRTAQQRYTGEADWNAIAAVADSVPVPVVGSGDVVSAQQALERQKTVSAVMIGRGAVGNPWIFAQLMGQGMPTISQRVNTALRHAELHEAFYAGGRQRFPLKTLRKVLPQYFPEQPELRPALTAIETLDDLQKILVPLRDSAKYIYAN